MVFQGPQSITNVIANMIKNDRTDTDVALIRRNLISRDTDALYWMNQGQNNRMA
ncbi:hypothetical protein ANO14919_122060 [Xylariales sp. No.14919]|nr:hypothetical protein ANO14919_122060 [Xylariales sp. No.14919]